MGPSEGITPLPKPSQDDPCSLPPLHAHSRSGSDNNPRLLEQVNEAVQSPITFRSVSPLAWDFQSTQQVTPPPILLYPEGKQHTPHGYRPLSCSICSLRIENTRFNTKVFVKVSHIIEQM